MEITENNVNELLKEISEKYLPEEVVLIPFGLISKHHINRYGRDNFLGLDSIEKLNILIKEIPKYFQKNSLLGKKYWNTSSYGSKHKFSELIKHDYTDSYVTNGEFIFAMLLLGYEMKPINFDKQYIVPAWGKGFISTTVNPNGIFNSSIRNLSKVDCECGLQFTKASRKQHEKSKIHQLIMSKKIN